jgi:hypothetical protein
MLSAGRCSQGAAGGDPGSAYNTARGLAPSGHLRTVTWTAPDERAGPGRKAGVGVVGNDRDGYVGSGFRQ